ncbi:hypothetical protein SAMN05444955_103228 [Lihuaxuella thermophila]|uniref:Uncharacterized protein n=1 Tax=Lihuaxuella thermophila TaxID=1173111 RepID=A0A1H8CDL9_9BACL|nr:hypothetical protein SAMN05444955_103228 [Lihuaxuella thermophila]
MARVVRSLMAGIIRHVMAGVVIRSVMMRISAIFHIPLEHFLFIFMAHFHVVIQVAQHMGIAGQMIVHGHHMFHRRHHRHHRSFHRRPGPFDRRVRRHRPLWLRCWSDWCRLHRWQRLHRRQRLHRWHGFFLHNLHTLFRFLTVYPMLFL